MDFVLDDPMLGAPRTENMLGINETLKMRLSLKMVKYLSWRLRGHQKSLIFKIPQTLRKAEAEKSGFSNHSSRHFPCHVWRFNHFVLFSFLSRRLWGAKTSKNAKLMKSRTFGCGRTRKKRLGDWEMTLEGSIKFHNFEWATAGGESRKSFAKLKFIFQWLKKFMAFIMENVVDNDWCGGRGVGGTMSLWLSMKNAFLRLW